MKPLGHKSYGHIPHLPGSRIGEGDHKCSDGQKRICCEKTRDKHDKIIVQEKSDGSNVGIAKINGAIVPLTRAGYSADTSPFEQHHKFFDWVMANVKRFSECISEGERLCGEWLLQAHGTRYILPHEPFICFDIMRGMQRACYDELVDRLPSYDIVLPNTIHIGDSFSIESAMSILSVSGHGAIDPVEGAVWRVERNELIDKKKGGERRWIVDFLAKFVRPDKKDGYLLPEMNNGITYWNKFKGSANFNFNQQRHGAIKTAPDPLGRAVP